MDQDKNLLTQSLIFNIANHKQKETDIFAFVIDGKLTLLDNLMHQFNNVQEIINAKDFEGKTPLFYAWFFNYNKKILQLQKYCDVFANEGSGSISNIQIRIYVFHVCAQRGNLECLQILFQMFKHKQSMAKWEELKITMKKYQIKKSDSQKGQLINADKHLKQVQQRFQQFQAIVSEQYQQFLDQNLQYFKLVNMTKIILEKCYTLWQLIQIHQMFLMYQIIGII
ncbi:unnamed protein product (macronuclear) [Paramecium tetraurelia]|uniref:Ankyrin repeat-containing domain n=1 Tax=Paramecium tetraurelia TaxID=5888 RepID=A0BPJ6_PARTE|nr:uncharacterized protein GSPATT00005212001 [Paramecium tetraurelia]CAK60463.1 unnamed protein product [Paramecium tetraurelia]|eukprot:XP_001427861.1 hypothetical protein (macronuclear) [Paramecium tetraurelia strain d4-2]